MENTQLNEQPDRPVWRWTADGTYTARSAYRMLHHGTTSFRGHRLIWKTWAPLRVKIFLWLALRRHHWTADRRARHGLEARDTCFLCDQDQENRSYHRSLPVHKRALASHSPSSWTSVTCRDSFISCLVATPPFTRQWTATERSRHTLCLLLAGLERAKRQERNSSSPRWRQTDEKMGILPSRGEGFAGMPSSSWPRGFRQNPLMKGVLHSILSFLVF